MNKKPLIAVIFILIFAASFTFVRNISNDNPDIQYSGQGGNLSGVKTAVVYENINDGVQFGRDMDGTINILQETRTDMIFRGFWKWAPVVNSPDNIPSELYVLAGERGISPEEARISLAKTGHYYEEEARWISGIKKEMPDVIFIGAIPAQTLGRIEFDPITGKVYNGEETWAMAFDPSKWDIKRNGKPVTKEEFQAWFYGVHPYGEALGTGYDRNKVPAYFPDITNPDFQELLVSWAKRQIDAGADGIWIDMLDHQAVRIAQITGDVNHPAIKESLDSGTKVVDEIHKYGESKGKYIYVGSWAGPFGSDEIAGSQFSYSFHSLDFVTMTPDIKEILDKKLDNAKWEKRVENIRKVYGDIPVFAFIDWSFDDSQTVAFSQKLTASEQREVLKNFDESFRKMGINFIYPLHGGYMGRGNITTKLASGKYRTYDSMAPEFDTYGTIKELSNSKK